MKMSEAPHAEAPHTATNAHKDSLVACTFSPALPDTYLSGCASGRTNCAKHQTLQEAETACSADGGCGGVTFQRKEYELRASNKTTPSPSQEPSTSWLIINRAACRHGPSPPSPSPPPPPPPSPPSPPPPPDHDAFLHSQAAFGGMTRTDPEAVWVYQTWIWRSFDESKLPYLHGWLTAVPPGRMLLLDQVSFKADTRTRGHADTRTCCIILLHCTDRTVYIMNCGMYVRTTLVVW